MCRVVVVGELNVDIVASGLYDMPVLGEESIAGDIRICPGSSSGICASAVAALGNKVGFIGKVGVDSFGQFMISELEQRGIETVAVCRDPDIRTPR